MESKNIFEVNGIKYSSNIPPQTKIGLNQEEYAEYLQLKNDSIPKQVIRDEIEKRKKHCTVINSFVIEALEELLGE